MISHEYGENGILWRLLLQSVPIIRIGVRIVVSGMCS